jgi:hypothetical protein
VRTLGAVTFTSLTWAVALAGLLAVQTLSAGRGRPEISYLSALTVVLLAWGLTNVGLAWLDRQVPYAPADRPSRARSRLVGMVPGPTRAYAPRR